MRTISRHATRCSSAVVFAGLLISAIPAAHAGDATQADANKSDKTFEMVSVQGTPVSESLGEDPNLLRFIIRSQTGAFAPRCLDLAHLLVDAAWAQDYKEALQNAQSTRPEEKAVVEEKLRDFDESLLGAAQTVAPAVGVISKVVNADDVKVPANVIYVRFSKPFLETYFCKQYERQMPVRDTILGAAVYGQSRTQARTEADLVENPSVAQAHLLFKGATAFNTTSYKGPVRIFSHGTTEFVSNKKLWFDGTDIQQSNPQTWAGTNTITDGISTDLPRLRGRIALRIASRRAAESHELAEQISNERTKRKVEHAFDNVVNERTTAFSQRLKEQYAKLPFEGRFSLSGIQCSTSPTTLQIVVLGRGEHEPSYTQAPVVLKDNPDIELHIHTALVQKAIFDPELRMALQMAVQNMVDNPVKVAGTAIQTVARSELKRELHIHWNEGQRDWLSMAWHAKEKPDERSPSIVMKKPTSSPPLLASPAP